MKTILLLCALAGSAHADSLDAIVRDRVQPSLPAGLGVARVYLPAPLADLEVDAQRVVVELPHELRAGRSSVKVTVPGRHASWVPVSVAALTQVAIAQRPLAIGDHLAATDVAIEDRALDETAPAPPASIVGATVTRAIALGAPIEAHSIAMPPPLSRGTQVAVEIVRGSVKIRGTATLELAARPGDHASARLAQTKIVVHGTLEAPATLIVGDAP